MDIGPIRFFPVNRNLQRTDKPYANPPMPYAWMLMTTRAIEKEGAIQGFRYVVVRFPNRERDARVMRSIHAADFENALKTLEYLVEHPEIERI